MSRTADKLKLWIGQPVNAPLVTPPVSLRLVQVCNILLVTAMLVYGVFVQLGHYSFQSLPGLQQILLVVAGFLLPICVAMAIATNNIFSRYLLVAHALLLGYLLARAAGDLSSPITAAAALAGIGFTLLATVWWLFASRRLRCYFALISGREVPADTIDDYLRPGKLEQSFATLGRALLPYLEGLLFLIAIISMLFMFDTSNWMA